MKNLFNSFPVENGERTDALDFVKILPPTWYLLFFYFLLFFYLFFYFLFFFSFFFFISSTLHVPFLGPGGMRVSKTPFSVNRYSRGAFVLIEPVLHTSDSNLWKSMFGTRYPLRVVAVPTKP